MKQTLFSGKLLFALMLFLLFPGITYSGINCHAKLTKVEKLICNNNDLVVLDRILNNMYNSISNSSDKYAYIKSDQRRWLNEERNKCKDEDSVLKLYNSRILLLKDYINDLHPNDIAKVYIDNNVNVCSDLVDLYNNNIFRVFRVNSEKPKDSDKDIVGERFVKYGNYSVDIGGNVYYLNIGNDQKEMRFIFVPSGGTCSSSEIYNLDILSSTDGKDNGRPGYSAMNEQGYDWGSHEILVKYLGSSLTGCLASS